MPKRILTAFALSCAFATWAFADEGADAAPPTAIAASEALSEATTDAAPDLAPAASITAVPAAVFESPEISWAAMGDRAGGASKQEITGWGPVYRCHVECPSGCFVDCIDAQNPCSQDSTSVSCHGQTYSCGNLFDEICLGF